MIDRITQRTTRLALFVLGLLSGSAFTSACAADIVSRLDAGGGLTVEVGEQRGRTFNANYGFVKVSNFEPKVLFQGRPVVIGAGASGNPLWDAWVIRSPAGPAVLAVNREVFLVTLRNGQPHAELIANAKADAATIQALDGKGGQPEAVTTVYQRNDVKDTRELPGDRLYLISGSAVLDGRTLRTSRLAISSAESRRQRGEYNPEPGKALLLSPRKSRTALFARGDQNRVALVVVDLGSGEVTQHLPIDRDQTYLGELDYYADATWAARYFEWSSSGGGEVLSLRRNAAAIPKIGWHLTSGNTLDHRYRLLAVETSMFDTFLAYTMAQHGAVMDGESTRDNFGRTANIRIGSRTLTVRWSRFESPPNFGHLEVSVNQYKLRAPLLNELDFPELIASLANGFNRELASGKHQQLIQKD